MTTQARVIGEHNVQKTTSERSVPWVVKSTLQTGDQPKSEESFWLVFAVVTLIILVVAAIRWSFGHPYGIHWDEAQYLNDIGIDVERLRSGLLLRLAGRILMKSQGHPPAFRLLALPFVGLLGFHTMIARLVSLAWFALSSCFIYVTTRRLCGRAAGGFAVLVFSLAPEVVAASIFFGTDTALYLATAALLYYTLACWSGDAERPSTWFGLGLAVGLGLLAKTSFLAIVLPVLVFWVVVARWRKLEIPSLMSQRKTAVIALLVAGPWWLLNARKAFAYAQYARAFVRNSLGPPSVMTWVRWLGTVVQSLLGHGLSILIALVLIVSFVKLVIRKEAILSLRQKLALGLCFCAGTPIIVLQLFGRNHLLRHISPAVIPLAIAIAVLADTTGWTRSWGPIAVSSALFCIQLIMIVYPLVFPNTRAEDLGFVNGGFPWQVMQRFDQWDWRPVQRISRDCGLDSPKISYLGSGRVFNPPAIEFPWMEQITLTHRATFGFPEVTWLWRYEQGTLDWQKTMDSAGESDIVLTAPHYVGEVTNKEDLDNQHNAEFADRLSRDPHFRGPIPIEMGRFEPVEITVFLKNNLVCH